jgi:hypothetical protein
VWDAQHPAPKADDPDFERRLLKWFTDDASKQLRAGVTAPERLHADTGKAVEVLIGRTLATAGEVALQAKGQQDRGEYLQLSGAARNKTYGEELPVVVLQPKKPNGRAVIWLDSEGKSSLNGADGSVKPAVLDLVKGGVTVIGADLLFQGDFLADGKPLTRTRTVENPREFAGYTYGYNPSLFAQRTHDVLSLVKLLQITGIAGQPKATSVEVAGFGAAGPLVAAARAVAGNAISRAVVDTGGFRFGKLLDFRDPQFLPGGAKYLDVPGFLALGAPQPLWLAGEGKDPALVADAYHAAGKEKQLTAYTGEASQKELAAAKWLLK